MTSGGDSSAQVTSDLRTTDNCSEPVGFGSENRDFRLQSSALREVKEIRSEGTQRCKESSVRFNEKNCKAGPHGNQAAHLGDSEGWSKYSGERLVCFTQIQGTVNCNKKCKIKEIKNLSIVSKKQTAKAEAMFEMTLTNVQVRLASIQMD